MCWDPLFVWRASNTDNASVRKTVGEHGSKESLTQIAACLSASVSALSLVHCFPVGELAVCVVPLGYWMMIPAPPSVIALVAEHNYPPETWTHVYTDGSATKAITDGGAGIIIQYPSGATQTEQKQRHLSRQQS